MTAPRAYLTTAEVAKETQMPLTAPPPQTMSLAEFLLARFKEDEDAARREVVLRDGDPFFVGYEASVFDRHFTPARVLAECEAKRRLLADLATFSRIRDQAAEGTALPPALTAAGIVTGLEHAAKLLALPYADHPDYQQEWKPRPPSCWRGVWLGPTTERGEHDE